MGILMPLDDGDLQDVLFQVDVIGVAGILGHDFPGHHADNRMGAAVGKVCGGQGGHMEGVVGPLHQIGVNLRSVKLPQNAVVHELALLVHHLDVEAVPIVDDHKIRQIAGSNGAAVVQQEVPGGGVARSLHGHDGVCSQGDGFFHDIVNVALFQQVVWMLVVGAEHAALNVFAAQQRGQRLQIPGGSALADHNELSPLQLGHGLLHIGALMVGVHPGGDIGVQVVAGKARGVTVDLLMVSLGGHDLLHHLAVAVDDAHKVHHLRQPLYPGVVIEGVDGPVVQVGPGFVQGRGRDAGGQHEPHVHRQFLGSLEHVFDAVGAHDVGNFVGVGDDGGGAVGQNSLGKLLGAHQGALQMDMGINEARQHDLAGDVGLHPAAILSHAHNEPLCHGNIPAAQLVGKHIDIGGVFQHQVRRDPARRHIDDMELLVELAVDLPCVTFLHSHSHILPFSRAGRERN